MGLFEEIFGDKKREIKSDPDLRISFDVWSEKQPFYTKLPKDENATIKIKAADLRRISSMAYAAGFERGRL